MSNRDASRRIVKPSHQQATASSSRRSDMPMQRRTRRAEPIAPVPIISSHFKKMSLKVALDCEKYATLVRNSRYFSRSNASTRENSSNPYNKWH